MPAACTFMDLQCNTQLFMVLFYFSPNSSQELVEQEDRWCEGGLNLLPIHVLAKLKCIKNISTWQWLRIILQQNIVYPSGCICLLVVCPEILWSLIGSVSNLMTIQLIYQSAVSHLDQFHFNSNFQVLQEMYYILAIKMCLGLSVINEMFSSVNSLNLLEIKWNYPSFSLLFVFQFFSV